jgi:hypothetical protein
MRKNISIILGTNYMNDLTEQYLDKLYDDLSKEQQSLLTDIKTGTSDSKEKDLQKQFTLLNTLMMNTLRLRNLKKKIKQSLDN